MQNLPFCQFHTFIYLQGSQTVEFVIQMWQCFTPLFTYKVLKPRGAACSRPAGFTPLFTYKVLKQTKRVPAGRESFTPLFTYKVLKLRIEGSLGEEVSHLYLLTRFSNYHPLVLSRNQFHTFIYLQGSQTS